MTAASSVSAGRRKTIGLIAVEVAGPLAVFYGLRGAGAGQLPALLAAATCADTASAGAAPRSTASPTKHAHDETDIRPDTPAHDRDRPPGRARRARHGWGWWHRLRRGPAAGTLGCPVTVADLDAVRSGAVADEIGGLFVRLDVTRPEENHAAVAETISAYGRLDVAVLNAGGPGSCGRHDFTAERYRATMAVDLDGAVCGLQACLPAFRAQGPGSVVVVSSIAGLSPSPDVFYSAAKHALIGLVRSSALVEPPHVALAATER